MPFLRYVATLDARTRPDHRRWHGTVLPADDPWWQSHYPPNGWRCRCTVVQLSAGDLRRRGWAETPRPQGGDREWVNRRTGEISRVPEGIDPGFERHAAAISPGAAARRSLDGKIAAAPPDLRAAAGRPPSSPGEFAAEGRLVRESLAADPAADPARFRAALLGQLRRDRGAGRAESNVQAAFGAAAHESAAGLVREASRLLPRSWVEAANASGPLAARWAGPGAGGNYVPGDLLVKLGRAAGPGAALHEYVHHLQAALPGFQRAWREEHLRRTTGADGARHPLAPLAPFWPNRQGRGDDYHPELVYAGVDYGPRGKFGDLPDGDAQEVATVAHQVALGGPWFGREMLGELAQRDPRLLDLLLGFLFRYDP